MTQVWPSRGAVITFGATLPLTGALATEARSTCTDTNVERQVNARGGINVGGVHKVDIKNYDYKVIQQHPSGWWKNSSLRTAFSSFSGRTEAVRQRHAALLRRSTVFR